MNLERAEYMIRQAFDADEAGDEEEAANLYMEAAELCLNLVCYIGYTLHLSTSYSLLHPLHFALSLNAEPKLPAIAAEPLLVFEGNGMTRHWDNKVR